MKLSECIPNDTFMRWKRRVRAMRPAYYRKRRGWRSTS